MSGINDDEVMWTNSLTGDYFQCVHVDAWREAKAEIARMEKALREILDGAQNQGPHTGMSWQEVARLCKEVLPK